MKKPTVVLLMVSALASPGCRDQTSATRASNQWYGWRGTVTIDPDGDVARLQGKWSRPAEGEGIGRVPETWVVFEGDTLTFGPPMPVEGRPDHVMKYRFALNSSVRPKVVNWVEWLGTGDPWPGHQAPQARWYSLDGDTLTLWDQFYERGERPKATYRWVTGSRQPADR